MAKPVVSIDDADVTSTVKLYEFIGVNSDQVVRVGINRTLPQVKTRASKEIRDQVRLTASYVRNRLKVIKATKQKLVGRISAPERGLLLTRYVTGQTDAGGGQKIQIRANSDKVSLLKAPRPPARGIRVKVKPKGATKKLVGNQSQLAGKPFYMIFPTSRALGVVARKVGGGLKVFYGASLSQVFDDTRDRVEPFAGKILIKETLTAADRLLDQKFPRE